MAEKVNKLIDNDLSEGGKKNIIVLN